MCWLYRRGGVMLLFCIIGCYGERKPEELECITIESPTVHVVGTVDDVESVTIDLLAMNPQSTSKLATREIRQHVEFDLRRTNPATSDLEGTATVTRTEHETTVYTDPEACGGTLFTDYTDREWTVTVKATLSCTPGKGEAQFTLSGTTELQGGGAPVVYRVHDTCFDQTTTGPAENNWNLIDESGVISNGSYELREPLPLPEHTTGEKYHEVKLTITES